MNATLLLISTFGLVFALGLQSQLVNNGHYAGAFFNSLMISLGQLGALQVINANTTTEFACYLLGGPFGIVCSMHVYHRYLRKHRHGTHSVIPVTDKSNGV